MCPIRREAGVAVPRVSVVMAVRDGAAFLAPAVESILAQNFSEFELIVVDDGSADGTPALLAEFAARDRRVRVLTQSPAGLITALNHGIAAAAAALIARMDADDIAKPERLARQVDVLAARPEVAVVGSAVELIDRRGKTLRIRQPPTEAEAVRAALPRANCIAHPTVMMRRDTVVAAGGYRHAFVDAEDYDLWLRIAERHDLINLPEPLLLYREHAGQLTWRDPEQRILSELAALAAGARRRVGGKDAADGVEPVTRTFLRDAGLTDADIAMQVRARAIGSAIDALAAGHNRAARQALTVARRQGPMPTRSRVKASLLWVRSYLGSP